MRDNQPITSQQRLLDPKRPIVTKTDLSSKITYANPAFVDISGYERSELIGQPHNVVRHPHMPPAAFADMWNTIKAGRPWQGLVKNRSKDGGYYWVDAYATPVTENGETVGYMSVRSAPSTSQIQAAESLYQNVLRGQATFPNTPPPPSLRFAWLISAAVALPAIVGWALAALGVSHWITLPILVVMIAVLLAMTMQAVNEPLKQAFLAIRHISEGNLKEPVATKATREFNALLTNLESMRVNLRAIIADAASAADNVGAQATTLSEQTAELTTRSHQQADGVASVAAALEQLTVAVGEIAEATNRGAGFADSAREVTRQGVAQMNEVQLASESIVEVVGTAQVTLHELDRAVSEISAITQTIKEIADQTNLLALNAAIEAARAGEQGRGFAVVADEVRKLSERTALSTTDIAGTIEKVEQITQSALGSMQVAVKAAEEGKSRILKTRDSLGEIESATAGVAEASHEVADVLAQQSRASAEVAVSTERMSALTEQNSESIDRAAVSAGKLSGIAHELHALLRHFERSL